MLLGIKEDEGWFLAWFGALVALGVFRSPGRRSASDARRKERTLGFAVVALALANGFAYYVVASHFGYTPEHPRYGIADSQWPQQLAFLLEMLVPFSFAPLRLGWRVLAALPFFAELFFTQDRTYPLYHIGAYYTVPLVVCAALATAYVAARVSSVARYALAGSILMAALFNNASVVHLGRRPFSPDPQHAFARAWAQTQQPVDSPAKTSARGRLRRPMRTRGSSAAVHRGRVRRAPPGETFRSAQVRPGRAVRRRNGCSEDPRARPVMACARRRLHARRGARIAAAAFARTFRTHRGVSHTGARRIARRPRDLGLRPPRLPNASSSGHRKLGGARQRFHTSARSRRGRDLFYDYGVFVLVARARGGRPHCTAPSLPRAPAPHIPGLRGLHRAAASLAACETQFRLREAPWTVAVEVARQFSLGIANGATVNGLRHADPSDAGVTWSLGFECGF